MPAQERRAKTRAVFLDCDMAILGALASETFAAYDRAIAEEYSAVPRWLYRMKRRKFFRKLLASERIFLSDFFRERFESAGAGNLQAALKA
jgi:predicted metal-dependent HD superfamily phosphohydrolase